MFLSCWYASEFAWVLMNTNTYGWMGLHGVILTSDRNIWGSRWSVCKVVLHRLAGWKRCKEIYPWWVVVFWGINLHELMIDRCNDPAEPVMYSSCRSCLFLVWSCYFSRTWLLVNVLHPFVLICLLIINVDQKPPLNISVGVDLLEEDVFKVRKNSPVANIFGFLSLLLSIE